MTIERVKSIGWGVGEKLTSAQQNAIDLNTTFALDKRAGQTDTLGSVVSQVGGGRLVSTYVAGANADTTYLVSNANATIDVAALTADRAYTLGNTNAIASDRIFILNRSDFYVTVKNGAGAVLIVLGSAIQGGGQSGWAELLFTGSAWVVARSALRPSLTASQYNASGEWPCPHGITLALFTGWGAGGSGGNGGDGTISASESACGGGGGGGAQRGVAIVNVTPGTVYTVTVAPSASPSVEFAAAGLDGGDTSSSAGPVFAGAGGGAGGGTAAATRCAARGGAPNRNVSSQWKQRITHDAPSLDSSIVQITPGAGGAGVNFVNLTEYIAGQRGSGNSWGTGGAGGLSGSEEESTPPGGGGGGGGGGPNGSGGAGGHGGDSGNDGLAGTPGGQPAANSGAGGGGGGGGGSSTGFGTPGAGAGGGASGSGKMIILPLR